MDRTIEQIVTPTRQARIREKRIIIMPLVAHHGEIPEPGDLLFIGASPTEKEIKIGISEVHYRYIYTKFVPGVGYPLYGGVRVRNVKELCCVVQVAENFEEGTDIYSNDLCIVTLLRGDGSICYVEHFL